MPKYILKRIFALIPTLIGVLAVIFLILRLIPGDPAEFMLGEYATEEALAALRAQLGLDQPLIVQFGMFMKNVLRGDLGISLTTKQPVMQEVFAVFPYSLKLAGAGMFMAILIGIPLGVISAVKQNSAIDYISMVFALFGVSMPIFWLGMMCILLFSFYIPIFPAAGAGDPNSLISTLWYLFLPALALGMQNAASIARLVRSSMLEVIRQDYIQTSRAKGLREVVVICKHALQNAIVPVLSLVGTTFGWALGSSILLESVFSRPGLGQLMIKAVFQRNYPIVQAGMLVLALCFLLVNLVTDLLYAAFDPRIRYK